MNIKYYGLGDAKTEEVPKVLLKYVKIEIHADA